LNWPSDVLWPCRHLQRLSRFEDHRPGFAEWTTLLRIPFALRALRTLIWLAGSARAGIRVQDMV
jgi:hypothetical protein